MSEHSMNDRDRPDVSRSDDVLGLSIDASVSMVTAPDQLLAGEPNQLQGTELTPDIMSDNPDGYILGKTEAVVLTAKTINRASGHTTRYSMWLHGPDGDEKVGAKPLVRVIAGAPAPDAFNLITIYDVAELPGQVLITADGPSGGQPVCLLLTDVKQGGEPLVVGREGTDPALNAALVLDVSRRHCGISLNDGSIRIENFNPANDTLVRMV